MVSINNFLSFFLSIGKQYLFDGYTCRIKSKQYLGASSLKVLSYITGLKRYSEDVKYGIIIYRLEYRRSDNEIWKSLSISIPQMEDQCKLIAIQRPTIFLNKDAPSEGFVGFELFASAGAVCFISDLDGFGSDVENIHPYICKEQSKNRILSDWNFIKKFLDFINIDYQDNMNMIGYSEGGYVSASVYEELSKNIEIDNVFLGAGCFDIKYVIETKLKYDSFENPSFVANLFFGYKNFYWNQTKVFSEKYEKVIPHLLSGYFSRPEIDSNLDPRLKHLLDGEFLDKLINKDENLIKTLDENSIKKLDFDSNVYLFHSKDDKLIPIEDSIIFKDNIKTKEFNFIELEGSHIEAAMDMIKKTIEILFYDTK